MRQSVSPNHQIPGYLLAGGKSRRFGSDKARIPTSTGPLIQVLARQLSQCCGSVTVIADVPDKYEDLGLLTRQDRVAGKGPLAGLLTALEDARQRETHDWILVLTCDTTVFNPAWLDLLSASAGQPGNKAVLFAMNLQGQSDSKLSRPKFQPFPGLYHISLIDDIVSQLETESYSFQLLLGKLDHQVAEIPVPSDWPTLTQINTQADFDRWQHEAKS